MAPTTAAVAFGAVLAAVRSALSCLWLASESGVMTAGRHTVRLAGAIGEYDHEPLVLALSDRGEVGKYEPRLAI